MDLHSFRLFIAYQPTICYYCNRYIIIIIIHSDPHVVERLSLWLTNSIYHPTVLPIKDFICGITPQTHTHTHTHT